MRIEDLYYLADKAIDDGNISESRDLLEKILSEDPSYANAHNHLGWLYKYKFADVKRAENHYRLAIKFNPEGSAQYMNLAYLLRDQNRLDELEEVLNKALNVDAVSKVSVYDEIGSLHELRGNYKKATRNYKKAISLCLNNNSIEDLNKSIERCKVKKGMFFSFFSFLDRMKK